MIKSFADKNTEKLFNRQRPRKLPSDIWERGHKKLLLINAAVDVSDLAFPPGNRLEKLTGDLRDYYSIRINDRWRVCLRWEDGNAQDVEICDYH